MRTLPRNKTENHIAIIEATRDFYNETMSRFHHLHIALEIMGRKRGNKELSEQDKIDMQYIKQNLADPIYRAQLI